MVAVIEDPPTAPVARKEQEDAIHQSVWCENTSASFHSPFALSRLSLRSMRAGSSPSNFNNSIVLIFNF